MILYAFDNLTSSLITLLFLAHIELIGIKCLAGTNSSGNKSLENPSADDFSISFYRQVEMRVSETDMDGSSQCDSGFKSNTTESNFSSNDDVVAVCRLRRRCIFSKVIQPLRLCRVSTRSVFGRTLDGTVMPRKGPEGVCCQIDRPPQKNHGPQHQHGINHAVTKVKHSEVEFSPNEIFASGEKIWSFIPPRSDMERFQSETSEMDVIPYSSAVGSNSETVRERTSSRKEIQLNEQKSFIAMNIGDLGLDCGRRNLSYKMMRLGRIVGGETAGFSDWPWVVMILNYGRPRCGGTLLSNQTVVTAAHCVSGNMLLYNLTVRIGMYNTNERDTLPFPPVHRGVQHIIRHPEFDLTTLLNDVAILHLSHPVTFAPNIMPACLASQEYPPNTPTLILGWGKEEENNSVYELPDFLQVTSVPIFNRQDCAKYFTKQGLANLIGIQHICAGSEEGGRDACQGDSGGPMLLANPDGRFELLGIISWGFGCGEPHTPAVYTNIFQFKAWMIDTIKQLHAAHTDQ